jgi:hypothetical protein
MWEARRLPTLWASTTCYKDSFIFIELALSVSLYTSLSSRTVGQIFVEFDNEDFYKGLSRHFSCHLDRLCLLSTLCEDLRVSLLGSRYIFTENKNSSKSYWIENQICVLILSSHLWYSWKNDAISKFSKCLVYQSTVASRAKWSL